MCFLVSFSFGLFSGGVFFCWFMFVICFHSVLVCFRIMCLICFIRPFFPFPLVSEEGVFLVLEEGVFSGPGMYASPEVHVLSSVKYFICLSVISV